ncbi:tape measure protein [Thalassospira sp. CH_XMU1458]|uniref:tape measure protein n=1 Tax=Thalassospira sp. CH_XMU1458 TaxID=3107776 RepID=UPI00300C8657
MTGVGIMAGTGMLARGVIDTASAFEKYQTTLTTITGSADKAKASMAWITDFTTRTPYQLDQVTDSFVKLRAYGIDPTDGTLSVLGDASSALGKDLNAAVEMLADAQTGEFERLKEFNIRGTTDGDMANFNFTDRNGVQRTFSAIKGNAADTRAAILNAFKAMGFEGGMKNQMKTWGGMVSNLADIWTNFQKRIADAGVFDFAKSKLQSLLNTINKMAADGRLSEWAQRISDGMIAVFSKIESFFDNIDWQGAWDGLQSFVAGVQSFVQKIGGWENALIGFVAIMNAGLIASIIQLGVQVAALVPTIAAVFSSLGAIMAANPIIAAIAAIGAAVYVLYDNWENIVSYFTAKFDAIRSAFSDGLLSGIVSVLQAFNPVAILSDAFYGLVEWATGVDLRTIGASWIDSLGAGIKDAWASLTSWISEAFTGLVDWLPDWAREKLGISGPDGMLGAQSTVSRPARIGASAAVASSMLAAPAMAAMPSEATPLSPTASSDTMSKAFMGRGSGAKVEIHMPVTFNGPVSKEDGQAVAREIELAVERALELRRDAEKDAADAALYD